MCRQSQRFNWHDNYNTYVNNGTCTGGKTRVIFQGQKFKKIMSSSEKVFYGGNTQFNYAACKWIERQAELFGKHIHHALCGHGGEYCVTINKKEILIDGYEPESRTIFQYYGCKWHGCPCQKERSHSKYDKTIRLEETMKKLGYSVVSVWECQKPELARKKLKRKFIPYPYFIVYDFEALLEKINEQQTDEYLTINSKHVPLSVAINDSLTNIPTFLVDKDPEKLIAKFVKELIKRQAITAEKVEMLYRSQEYPDYQTFVHLPKQVIDNWKSWVKQVPVFGFNSGKYDINMIKNYLVKNIASISDGNVAKKENTYMFLTLPEFTFLDIKNYLAPGLSYDAWCKAYGCKLKKLIFPYEWLATYEKLSHVGPCPREAFNNSLRKTSISEDQYKDFCDEFSKRKCIKMGDWLREYSLTDVVPFIEALDKTRKQYYPDEIDLLKDAVSIPGISMTYVL